MGKCCSKPSSPEEFIKDVLNNMEIRKMNFEEFDKIIKTNHICPHKKSTHSRCTEEKYIKLFLAYFLNEYETNELAKFQICLRVDYHINEFEYVLYSWAFSLLKNENKLKGFFEFMTNKYGDFKENTFKEFLKFYLNLNLITFSELILGSTKTCHETINNYSFNDENFKQEFLCLVKKVFCEANVNKFYDRIIKDLDIIKIEQECKTAFTLETIDFLFKKNPYLIDVISLRSNFYSIYLED